MSHELRTPLNAVIGFSRCCWSGCSATSTKQEDYLRDIRDAGRHLLALLNDVLDLSKVEAGQMELEITTFDAATAFHYALSLVRERAAQHGIDLAPRRGAGAAGHPRRRAAARQVCSTCSATP
jgi:signal transduction histidine kinase